MNERQKAFDAFERTGLVSVKAGLAADTHGMWMAYALEWVAHKEADIGSTRKSGRVRAAISLVAQEYDAFRRLIPDDERLPATYDEWVKRRADEDAQSEARGEIVKQVVIHSEEFGAHCLANGQEPSYSILEALAAEQLAPNQ